MQSDSSFNIWHEARLLMDVIEWDDTTDRRSFIRVPLQEDCPGTVQVEREDGAFAWARLLDISIGGARLALMDAEPDFLEGVEMLIFRGCRLEPFACQMEGMHAQVVWKRQDQAGLLFECLLS